MCDTLVALKSVTKGNVTLFAKNSDREPNEAQQVVWLPRANHAADSDLQCTYISIPQVPLTHAVLLCKPFWIWGAEMGVNEHKVVIGNEAVFTRVPHEKQPGLIGMDLLRLALERANTARSALEVITNLLTTYGQSGNCGLTHRFFYHNSFLIADPSEAWVLETVGREWVAARVHDIGTISNALTLSHDWDLASSNPAAYARKRKWCRRDDFDWTRCYSEPVYTHFSAAHRRQCRTDAFLQAQAGQIDQSQLFTLLRDHGATKKDWTPAEGLTGADVCMHAGFGPIRVSQTTGSLVVRLTSDEILCWVTGTAAPCIGIFKPVWLDAGLPTPAVDLSARYNPNALWWRHEVLHRAVLQDYQKRLACYRAERDALEMEFVQAAENLRGQPVNERAKFTATCFKQSAEALERWIEKVQRIPARQRESFLYRYAWRRFIRAANIPEI